MNRPWLVFLGCLSASCEQSRSAPPTPPIEYARPRLIVGKEFKVGMLPFASGQGDPHGLHIVVPSMILAELGNVTEAKKPQRYATFEAGVLEQRSSLTEGSAGESLDGYINGTITSTSDSQVCLDFRLSNAFTHEVLATSSKCIGLDRQGRGALPRQEGIHDLAFEISDQLGQPEPAKILNIDDQILTIDKGIDDGVKRGMAAYLREVGVAERSPDEHAGLLRAFTGSPGSDEPPPSGKGHDQIVVGEIYILSVDQSTSIGVLYRGSFPLAGDVVEFK